MSDTSNQEEPSIEEILASIRKIINEDEEGGETAEKSADETGDNSTTESFAVPSDADTKTDNDTDSDEDILELTEMAPADEPIVPPTPAAAAESDEDQSEAEEDITMEEESEEPVEAPEPDANLAPGSAVEDGLVSAATAAAATSAMSQLASAGQQRAGSDLGQMPVGAHTLEDIVREMLRPMLKEWLDRNLPSMVEKLVQRELEKLGQQADRY